MLRFIKEIAVTMALIAAVIAVSLAFWAITQKVGGA